MQIGFVRSSENVLSLYLLQLADRSIDGWKGDILWITYHEFYFHNDVMNKHTT